MTQHFLCWDGPKEGEAVVDVPMCVTVGHACALPWKTTTGASRYAVYILLQKPNGDTGLVYERSYDKPYKAAQRVSQISWAVDAIRGEPRQIQGTA